MGRADSETRTEERGGESKMRQSRTDYGEKGETGEREPKGEKASDTSGERKMSIKGGVAMGERDKLTGREASHAGKHDGRTGEYNGGREASGHCYTHSKPDYPGSEKAKDKA